MPIVTISRQYGAAGRPVGLGLARRLGAEFLDRQLVATAAQRAGLSVEEAEGYDEGVPGLLQRLAADRYSGAIAIEASPAGLNAEQPAACMAMLRGAVAFCRQNLRIAEPTQ